MHQAAVAQAIPTNPKLVEIGQPSEGHGLLVVAHVC